MRTARVIDKSSVQGITNLLEAKVNEMVAGAQKRAAGQADAPLLPLVRLRVDYTGFSTINAQRFGQRFVGKVANPHDLLLFQKAPARKAKVCFYAASCNCLLGVALVMLMLFQAIVKGFRSCCALRSATEFARVFCCKCCGLAAQAALSGQSMQSRMLWLLLPAWPA